MLSNPTTLHQRQRQHRRQRSTPTAFEAAKVPNLPNIHPHGSHRRGLSLDQRRRQPPQVNKTVSSTNQGFQQTQQHILRETQRQRLARPGTVQQIPPFERTDDENYLISPLASPHGQFFDSGCPSQYGGQGEYSSPYPQYPSHDINFIRPDHCSSAGHSRSQSQDSISTTNEGLSQSFVDFSINVENFSGSDNWATIKASGRPRSGRRVSGGIADRVAMFECIAGEGSGSRPATPSHQNATSYFPLTPAATPFNRIEKHEKVPERFLDSYDTSMEETIRPNRSKSNQRTRTIFQEMRDHVEMKKSTSPIMAVPPQSDGTLECAPISTADFMNMANLDLDFMQSSTVYEPSQISPMAPTFSPQVSHHSSPQASQNPALVNPFEATPQVGAPESLAQTPECHSPLSVHRGQSPSIASPLQQSDFDLAQTITETGVTFDDIACYISGPNPGDQKWTCLYPNCKKRFGRKENIKSHVQTHLGDRQYQCSHCRKCFVRQHDLKRHAKIHSGVKPYPCACGNSFARHDALTRHRQRGMCIGAFEGVVKKVVKRGRPRKVRPDAEERLDKASRTRSKNKAISYASSTSGYSESSYGNSPRGDMDMLDDKAFGDFTDFSQSSTYIENFPYSAAASPIATDYVSPQAIHHAPSPSVFSSHSQQSYQSFHSPRGSVDYIPPHQLPALPTSPAKSIASYYNTPPELCLSSSSPPPSNQFYEASQPSEADDMDLSKLAALQHIDMDEHHDDMFLDAFGTDGDMSLSRLEQDPSLLLLGGKLDDAFAEWAEWT